MSDRATLEAMVAYLREHLVKTEAIAPGETVTALAETAVRFNDTRWFWTDDNAKAAELLCEPGLYDSSPREADAAIDFVLRMSKGDIIRRRCGPAELRVVSDDPKAFRVETGFGIVEGDLSRGIVRQAQRFNDNRTTTVAEHGPAPLTARVGWRAVRLDPAIAEQCGVEVAGGKVVLWHGSPLCGRGRVLGEVRYSYEVRAERPGIEMAVEVVPAAGVVLEGVVLGTGLKRMQQSRTVQYRALAVVAKGRERVGRLRWGGTVHRGEAGYVAALQGRASPGFSYGVHCLLPDGERLARITADVFQRGRLRGLRHHYRLGRVAARASVRERRMITGGGYYDRAGAYAALLEGADGGAAATDGGTADPSMSYDIGAELNAVAAHVLFALRGAYARAPDAGRMEALQAWYDRHVEWFFGFIGSEGRAGPGRMDRVFTRGVAFVVLSLDCMLRATGEARYRARLAEGVALVLATGRANGDGTLTFGDPWSVFVPFLDNHAACILALARASWHGDPGGRLARTVHASVAAIRDYEGRIDVGNGHMVDYDGLAVPNPAPHRAHADTGFWTFKLGIVLRALHAALAAADGGALATSAAERAEMVWRIERARALVEPCLRRHEGSIEALTSAIAGETNSETQPWVALGLVPVLDERIVALQPPGGRRCG